MEFLKFINCMKKSGVHFSLGLTNDTITKIEKIYEVQFPDSLKKLYKTALPISLDGEQHSSFPIWNDFSQNNINAIRQRMNAPYQWLIRDIENGFWLPEWQDKTINDLLKDAPKLIPIYSHRYLFSSKTANSPVISIAGRDTIWYGISLDDYLMREFCGRGVLFETLEVPYVSFWSDIVSANQAPIL